VSGEECMRCVDGFVIGGGLDHDGNFVTETRSCTECGGTGWKKRADRGGREMSEEKPIYEPPGVDKSMTLYFSALLGHEVLAESMVKMGLVEPEQSLEVARELRGMLLSETAKALAVERAKAEGTDL
jgi:hypothetical protein